MKLGIELIFLEVYDSVGFDWYVCVVFFDVVIYVCFEVFCNKVLFEYGNDYVRLLGYLVEFVYLMLFE